MSDGMTRREAEEHAAALETVGRAAFFVREMTDGEETFYLTEYQGQDVIGSNPFQLDSNLTHAGAPAPRNLYLIRSEDW